MTLICWCVNKMQIFCLTVKFCPGGLQKHMPRLTYTLPVPRSTNPAGPRLKSGAKLELSRLKISSVGSANQVYSTKALQWHVRNLALKGKSSIVFALNGQTLKGVSCGLVYLRVVLRVTEWGSGLHFQSWKELIYGRPHVSRGDKTQRANCKSISIGCNLKSANAREMLFWKGKGLQSVSSCYFCYYYYYFFRGVLNFDLCYGSQYFSTIMQNKQCADVKGKQRFSRIALE